MTDSEEVFIIQKSITVGVDCVFDAKCFPIDLRVSVKDYLGCCTARKSQLCARILMIAGTVAYSVIQCSLTIDTGYLNRKPNAELNVMITL